MRTEEDVVLKCQADAGVGQPSTELEDEQVARATSAAAIKILLAQENNEATIVRRGSIVRISPCKSWAPLLFTF